MSFIGSIGNLMAETGLADIMASVFAGVNKMLVGKKFPNSMRALRMVVEVILGPIINDFPDFTSLMNNLEERAQVSKTCKLWPDCLIKPTILMMEYVRAEREGDFLLHVACVKAMSVYFFAGGHHNYARSTAAYLRTLLNLPEGIKVHFMRGDHVMRHMAGLWNGVWSDMFLESTFMHYGHGRTGIVGITLKPETLKTWALSRHICSHIMEDLANMRGKINDDKYQNTHKEEATARKVSDKKDRDGLVKKMETCINPLDPDSHPEQIVNVATGILSTPQVNVSNAIAIGEKQQKEFEESLPAGFWDTIKKEVKTMAVTKTGIPIGFSTLYDTELIFARVIGMQASGREVDFRDVLSYELSPIPTSLFDDLGEMRICKAKSDLKNNTKVEVSARNREMDCTVLDGSALLWTVPWPASSTTNPALVNDYIKSFNKAVERKLKTGDVYLVFDRYVEYSIKCTARRSRRPVGYKIYQLSNTSPLPAQTQVLTISENKKQLIALLVASLKAEKSLLKNTVHKLVITGQEDVPVELSARGVIDRIDLETRHEEADPIVVAQAMYLAREEKSVSVIADDTDIYMLCCLIITFNLTYMYQ